MISRPAAGQHLRDLAQAATSFVGSRLPPGESPYSYLMTRRIERAMALLRRGDLSVTAVWFAVDGRVGLLGRAGDRREPD